MVNGLPDATRGLFDDERAVANAGVLLPAVLASRLGIEGLVGETVDLGDRDGAANPGRKVMTLLSAMTLGADCIDDCDVLRSLRVRWASTRCLEGECLAASFRRRQWHVKARRAPKQMCAPLESLASADGAGSSG